MNIIRKIFDVSRKARPGGAEVLRHGHGYEEFSRLVFDDCIHAAAAFVQSETVRKESPFFGADARRFFNEMMLVDFWIIDKISSGGRRRLLEMVQDMYLRKFSKGEVKSFEARCREYHETWDDETGHHDRFGMKAAENILGRDEGSPLQNAAFWIIWHADKRFKKLAATLKADFNK